MMNKEFYELTKKMGEQTLESFKEQLKFDFCSTLQQIIENFNIDEFKAYLKNWSDL